MCSGYYPEEATSKQEVTALSGSFGWHVFKEEVPFSRSFPKGAREGSPIFHTSYARSTVAHSVSEFCNVWRVNLDERAATIKMALQRSRRDDDCRAATITQAVFSSSSI